MPGLPVPAEALAKSKINWLMIQQTSQQAAPMERGCERTGRGHQTLDTKTQRLTAVPRRGLAVPLLLSQTGD